MKYGTLNKENRAFNLGVYAQAYFATVGLDHVVALNIPWHSGYAMIRTCDDWVIIIDDDGHRFGMNRDGDVRQSYYDDSIGMYVYKSDDMASGEKSKRKQKYAYCTLYLKSAGHIKKYTTSVHVLMGLAFNRDQYVDLGMGNLVINHKDNCGFHNQADNLEWVSTSLNNLHGHFVTKMIKHRPECILKKNTRYLNCQVSAYTLRFALCLFKTVGGNKKLFGRYMRFLGNSALDPQMFVDEPFFPDIIRTASRHFLEDPEYVAKQNITNDFIDAFWSYRSWMFGR